MLFTFIKKNGNVERIGDVDAAALETKLQGYLNEGFDHAEAEEHDQQVIGAVNKQLEAANAKIAELEAAAGIPATPAVDATDPTSGSPTAE